MKNGVNHSLVVLLFGGMKTGEKKKLLQVKPKQECWAGGERFNKVNERKKSKTTAPRWES